LQSITESSSHGANKNLMSIHRSSLLCTKELQRSAKPSSNFKCHTGQILTSTSTDSTVTKAVTAFLLGKYLPSSTQITWAMMMMMMCRFGENLYLSAPYSAITTPAL
jgi:hypothetical protein